MTNEGPEHGWWLRPSELVREILQHACEPGVTARYRLADTVLEVDSNYGRVLELLRLHWDDCALPDASGLDGMHIRSSVRVGSRPDLALVSFEGSKEADGSVMAASRFQHLLSRRNSETLSPVSGWTLAHIRRSPRPFMTRCGHEALIDLSQEPLQKTPGFLHRYLLSAALSTQRNLLIVHAASVRIGGTGVLLMGPSASGKTTVSFALAARGHSLLSEEIAAIRLGPELLLPIRRTAGIRRGPRAKAVSERLEGRHWETEILQDGTERRLVRTGEVFPDNQASPTKLGCAFYLRGFAGRASVERIFPASPDALMQRLSGDTMAVSGVTPARRVMKLFTLLDMLSRRRCYFIDVGPPEETAELVERTVQQ